MDIQSLFKYSFFYQGDSWDFFITLPDYDSSVYTLNYVFAKVNTPSFVVSSTVSTGTQFNFSVDSTVTSTYTPGLYYVSAYLTDGTGKKTTLGQSEILIKADISLAANGDPRTPNKIAFDDVEAALASGAGSDVIEYTVGGTTVKKNRQGLMDLRAFYLKRVRQEEGRLAITNTLYNL